MSLTKHTGKTNNTGQRLLVVYREIPGDPQNALVVFTDQLPEKFHDDLLKNAEGLKAQETNNLFAYLFRCQFFDGTNILERLHQQGLLSKVDVDTVNVTPQKGVVKTLREINDHIRENVPEDDVEKVAKEIQDMAKKETANWNQNQDQTDQPPKQKHPTTTSADVMGIVDDNVEGAPAFSEQELAQQTNLKAFENPSTSVEQNSELTPGNPEQMDMFANQENANGNTVDQQYRHLMDRAAMIESELRQIQDMAKSIKEESNKGQDDS